MAGHTVYFVVHAFRSVTRFRLSQSMSIVYSMYMELDLHSPSRVIRGSQVRYTLG